MNNQTKTPSSFFTLDLELSACATEEYVVRHLADLDLSAHLIPLWNEYADTMDPSSRIYTGIDEVAEIAPSDDPLWLARALYFGDVESWNDAVYFDGQGNLRSVLGSGSPIDYQALAEWLLDQGQVEFTLVSLTGSDVEYSDMDLGTLFSEVKDAGEDLCQYELRVEVNYE